MKQEVVIIIFCDGRHGSSQGRRHRRKSHEPIPISAYRKSRHRKDRDDEQLWHPLDERDGEEYWHPIYSVIFRGKEHILERGSIDRLVGEEEAPRPDFSGVEQPVKRPEAGERWSPEEASESIHQKAQASRGPYWRLLEETGDEPRSQYRWRCPQPNCYNLPLNDAEAVHRLFEVYSHRSPPEVSLGEIDDLITGHQGATRR
jgi:hypothetical protein